MRVLALAAAMTVVGVAHAEDAAKRPWTDTAELGVVLTSGNSESRNVALANKFTYAWSNAEFVSNLTALRADSKPKAFNLDGTLVEPASETTAESYLVDGKYRRTINEGFFWYANAGWMRNRFTGIEGRSFAGAGVGYRFFKTDAHQLVGEAGATYTEETYVNPLPDGSDSANFASLRAYLGYERALSKTSKFSQDLEVLENLKDTQDLRAKAVSSVSASLTTRLALKASLTLLYDKQPVVEVLADVDAGNGVAAPITRAFDKLDSVLTATLVINF